MSLGEPPREEREVCRGSAGGWPGRRARPARPALELYSSFLP